MNISRRGRVTELFSKGDQLKVKMAKLKFSETGDGRLFLVLGRRLVNY